MRNLLRTLAAVSLFTLIGAPVSAQNLSISQLTAVGSVVDADLFADCSGGACTPTLNATASQIATYIGSKTLTLTNKTYTSGTMTGTMAGTPTFSGNLTFSGVPVFSGLATGACANDISINSSNQLILTPCAAGYAVQTTKVASYSLLYTGSGYTTGTDANTNIPVNCNACTITLPTSTGSVFPPGSSFIISNVGQVPSNGNSATVTIAATSPSIITGVQTANSGANFYLSEGMSAMFTVNASNNYFLSGVGFPAGMDTTTGTSLTFGLADCYQVRHFSNAAAITATVPTGLPTGCNLQWTQDGAGQVSFVAGGGFTLNAFGNLTASAGQYATGSVFVGAGGTTGILSGRLVAGGSPGSALALTFDNATNSSGQPSSTVGASFAFPFTTMQNVLSEPERFVLWNVSQAPLTGVLVGFTGTNSNDFSTAETNCPGTLNAGANCRIIINFKPATTSSESGNMVITASGNNSITLPLTGTGTAATVIAATCSTFNSNPLLNANTLYLLPAGTCSGKTFRTQSGTQVQGDCTKYDGTNTIFDGGSTIAVLTNGTSPSGDASSNVRLTCITVQHYGYWGSCTTGGADPNQPQLDTWNGWILSNDTFQLSCATGVGVFSTTTVRDSHITNNLHLGLSGNTNDVGDVAGTQTYTGLAFDSNSYAGSHCADPATGECGGFKALNRQGGGNVQNLTVNGGYFNETSTNANLNSAWCDGCYDMVFTVTGATLIGGGGGGIRDEISIDSATTNTASNFTHNVLLKNVGGQGNLMGLCGQRMTAKNNFIDDQGTSTVDALVEINDGRCNGVNMNVDWENNTIVIRATCSGFGGTQVCDGIPQTAAAVTVGTSTIKNNTFYVSSPYNTGSAIFIGGDAQTTLRSLSSMQSAPNPGPWETGSTITAGLPSGSPSGCTGDGKYPEGCMGSGF